MEQNVSAVSDDRIVVTPYITTINSQYGLNPLPPSPIFELKDIDHGDCKDVALDATVVVRVLTPDSWNTPAYRVNIGSGYYYEGGDIHDYGGVTLVKNAGALQTAFGVPLTIYPGDQVTCQTANNGKLQVNVLIEARYHRQDN